MTTKTSNQLSAKPLFSTYHLVLVGMFAAVLAVISQISIPMPSGVPITIQVFGIALTGAVLGWKLGLWATVVYILLGAVGLPIFANFEGGVRVLVGMSGGYIWGWPVLAALAGVRPSTANTKLNLAISVFLAIVGLMVVEFVGGFQWSRLSGDMSFKAIILYSFVAFIPKDIVITVLAMLIGRKLQKLLSRYLA